MLRARFSIFIFHVEAPTEMEIDCVCGTTDGETDGWSNSLTFAVSMDLLGFVGRLNCRLLDVGLGEVKKNWLRKVFSQS